VSTTPGDLPPPAAGPSGSTPTQIAGQQVVPSNSVPMGPPGALGYTSAGAGQTNSLAVISLVAGIGSFFAHVIPGIGGFTVAIVAVVTGFMARNQIKQTGEKGMGYATAGIVIGLIHIGLLVVGLLFILFLIFVVGIAFFGISTHTSTSGG
jgi:hypothetical protein